MINIGGQRWHLIDSGQGRPAVVFESGISASSLNWTQVRTELASSTRACAYDRASLGWSDPATTPRTATRLVEELHALLGAAGVPGPYVLVAHSFGALIVRIFAARFPAEVAGLVLIDPLAPSEWMQPSEAQARMLRRGVALSRRGALLARAGVVRLALALLSAGARRVPKAIAKLSSGDGESFISRLVGEVRKMPREVWRMVQAHWCLPQSFAGLAGYLESLPASSREAAASEPAAPVPVVILSGAHCTPAQLAERETMARRSVRGRHTVVAGSGHWIHLDEPALVIDAIRAMVDLTSR